MGAQRGYCPIGEVAIVGSVGPTRVLRYVDPRGGRPSISTVTTVPIRALPTSEDSQISDLTMPRKYSCHLLYYSERKTSIPTLPTEGDRDAPTSAPVRGGVDIDLGLRSAWKRVVSSPRLYCQMQRPGEPTNLVV